MARQVLPIAGAIVGAYFGSPQLGYAIGSMIGNAVDPQVIKGPSIGEARVQTSQEGAYRPVIYGTGCVAGNIINRGPRVIRRKRQSQGKGGGPVTETEHVYRTFAIRICEGPIAGVLRIWESEKLVYDARPESVIVEESEEYAKKFTVYLGGEDQLPDPSLEAYLGVGNASSYRGTCYIVFSNFDLTDFGDTIPQFRFEVSSSVIENKHDTIVVGDGFYIVSPDGINFPDPSPMTGPFSYVMAGPDRYIRWNNNSALYMMKGSDVWTPSLGYLGGSGGDRGGVYFNNGYIICGGLNNSSYSLDGGESFNEYGEYSRFNWVAASDDTAVAFRSGVTAESSRFIYSAISPSGGWRAGAEHGITSSEGGASFGGGVFKLFGGASSSPRMVTTENGSEAIVDDLPEFISSTIITSAQYGNGIWIAGTNEGEIAIHGQDGWVLSPSSVDRSVISISFNGSLFLILTLNYIYTTSNGIDIHRSGATPLGSGFRSSASLPSSSYVGGSSDLSSVIDSIHWRLGIPYGDTDGLSDNIDGLVLADGYSGADAIRTLSPIYMFDAAEYDKGSGYNIHYRKRGGPVAITISESDLVDEPEESVREDALERPRVLHMAFQSPTIGYAGAKASPRRNSPDIKVVGETAMSVPVTFKDVDEAWRRADVMLRVAWAEVAGDQKFSVSDKLLELVPTDIVGVSIRGKLRRMRVNKVSLSEGIASLDLIVDRQSSYTSNLTGVPLPLPEPPPPSIAGPTVGFQLDIPAMTDWDDYLLYYDAGSGTFPAWGGYELQRSTNGGSSYSEVTNVRRGSHAIIGTLVNNVSDSSQHYTDTTNTAVVRLIRSDDEIESIDQAALLSEGGSFALSWDDGGVKRWEVMQYRDVVQNSNGDWELSYLLRGRLNTQTESHIPGANFVLLETVTRVDALSGWLGSTLGHRQVSFGTTPETAVPSSIEYTGNSQREWPVAHLFAYEEFDMLEATCIPRHRFGTEDNPVQSINHSGYRWTATDGTNSETMDSSGTSVSFSVSGWARPITVSVSQLNRITGEGPAVSEILN